MRQITAGYIKKELLRIKNKYNQDYFDNDLIERTIKFIMSRSEDKREIFLSMAIDDYSRKMVKEYEFIIITKKIIYNEYQIFKKTNNKIYELKNVYVNNNSEVYQIAENLNNIYKHNYTTTDINFKTGNLVFINYFDSKEKSDYAFPIPKDKEHTEDYNICNHLGEQNCMKLLSETYNLGYAQLSNTTASVFKINDNKIIISSEYFYHYDEKTDIESEIQPPSDWEYLGNIDCGVWRIEFMDMENLKSSKDFDINSLNDVENVKCTINKGKWNIKNYHHFISDNEALENNKYPVWVELTKKD